MTAVRSASEHDAPLGFWNAADRRTGPICAAAVVPPALVRAGVATGSDPAADGAAAQPVRAGRAEPETRSGESSLTRPPLVCFLGSPSTSSFIRPPVPAVVRPSYLCRLYPRSLSLLSKTRSRNPFAHTYPPDMRRLSCNAPVYASRSLLFKLLVISWAYLPASCVGDGSPGQRGRRPGNTGKVDAR